MKEAREDRRHFLRMSGAACSAFAIPVVLSSGPVLLAEDDKKKKDDDEVSPAEDLMREHGALNRILLIYDDQLRRLEAKAEVDIGVLAGASDIVRHFVEDYHERLEEDHLFPRFRKAGKLVDLVDTLLSQHQAGRRLTEQIHALAVPGTLKNASQREQLSSALHAFLRMYRPHEAREDTVLFPAFRGLVSANEYAALGEQFEKKEDELFGEEGFFKVVDQISNLEKQLGIYELAQFTPRG